MDKWAPWHARANNTAVNRCCGGAGPVIALLSVTLSATLSVTLSATLLPSPAAAQEVDAAGADPFAEAKRRVEFEPTVAETTRASLRYFRVDPQNFDRLRRTSNIRALLPTLAAGYRLDRTDTTVLSGGLTGGNINSTADDTGSRVDTISVGAVFDLRELVFNPAEVQVYGLIGVQRGLMLEVTRIYYLRKQLFVRFLNNPPQDPLAREALSLRVDEFTALLDVLTGGWFSKTTEIRAGGTGSAPKRRPGYRPAASREGDGYAQPSSANGPASERAAPPYDPYEEEEPAYQENPQRRKGRRPSRSQSSVRSPRGGQPASLW